uniref:Glycosyl transferase family 1 domain-containing protein n=2 Tax=Acidianus TaxID=12914 RepID=A0A2U9IN74_9CREN
MLDAGSGGVKRNRETVKIWKKYVDEIIYIPLLGDLKRASVDDSFRKRMYYEAKTLGITIPQKIDEIIDDKKLLKNIKLHYNAIEYDLYSNILYYSIAKKIARRLGKINADIYYAQQEFPQMVYFLSEIATNNNIGALVQLENFYSNLIEDLKHFYNAYSSLGMDGIFYSFYVTLFRANPRRRKWEELIGEGRVKFAFSVSVDLSRLYPFMKKIRTKVLKPANAFDKRLMELRNSEKEDYAVFYARLSPAKGILDIPKIAKSINKKIIVLGKFINEKTKIKFMREKNDNIEYLGYVKDETLQEIVSKAKVLIYPSHMDSFSLVILESLAMGTPVVAYEIPGIKQVYSGLPGVHLVPENKIEQMKEEVKKIFSMPKSDYEKMMNDRKLLDFLEEHSSWEKVALNELDELKRVVYSK